MHRSKNFEPLHLSGRKVVQLIRAGVALTVLFLFSSVLLQGQNTFPWPAIGFVGIGTNNPKDALHVRGVPSVTSGAFRISCAFASGEHDTCEAIGQIAIAPFLGGYSSFANAGDLVIRTTPEPSNTHQDTCGHDIILTARIAGGGIRFGTFNSALSRDVERVTIVNNGNVGIGNNTPDALLRVGTNNIDGRIRMGSTEFIEDGGNDFVAVGTTNSAGTFGPDIDNAYHLGNAGHKWQDAWIAGKVNFGLWSFIEQNGVGGVTIGGPLTNIIPSIDAITEFGGPFRRWLKVWVSDGVHFGSGGSGGTIGDGGTNFVKVGTDSHTGTFGPDIDSAYHLGDALHRWIDVWAVNGTIQTSDATQKDNIHDLGYGLKQVLQLHPVSFTWKNHPDNGVKLGLLAQEVRTVLPEVVVDGNRQPRRDEKGNLIPKKNTTEQLGMYYSDIIPVLVRAIQEQNQTITEHKTRIEELTKTVSDLETRLARLEQQNTSQPTIISPDNKQSQNRYDNVILEQNIPNPFDGTTLVTYFIPSDIQGSIELVVSDITGTRVLQHIPINGTGVGSVSISAKELESGAYVYGISVNNQVVQSRKMIVTK